VSEARAFLNVADVETGVSESPVDGQRKAVNGGDE